MADADGYERLYASVVSDLQEGIVIADARGCITACNRSAERILATPEAQLLGLSADDADWLTFREDGSPMPADERPAVVTLRTGQPCSNLIMGVDRPDGGRIWLALNTQLLRDDAGAVNRVVTSFTDVTERRAMEETLRGLSGRLLRLQDDERRRLARELHDSSGSALVALTLSLEILARSTGAYGAREHAALDSARRMASEWGQALHRMAYLLHPPLLEEAGLRATLRWYCEEVSAQGGLQVESDLPQTRARLGRDIELALFRFVQEALSNVQRHAGGTRAVVRLVEEDGRLRLSVADDGRGIAPDMLRRLQSGTAGGMGVAGMRERARQLPGGRLHVASGPAGTTVTLETDRATT